MTLIDRAHKAALILMVTAIPVIFLVDLVVELIEGEVSTSTGWQVYATLVVVAAYQLIRKRWHADWIIVMAGLGTAALAALNHYGVSTDIDLSSGTIIVPTVGLIAIVISRRVPIVDGAVLGGATVYLATLHSLSDGLAIDDVIAKSLTVAVFFWFGGWLLYQLRRGYEDQFATRNRFVAAVTHELRTPLTALVGFSAALTDATMPLEGDDATTALGIISSQAQEAADIVEDLLVAFRSSSGDLSMNIAATDLADEAETVIAAVAAYESAESKRISLNLDSAPVHADPLRLRQIIRNLLTNACRHGGDNIEVRSVRTGAIGVLTVADNGRGFDPDEVETLFQPYGRSRHTDTSTGSIGLGLTVARQLARRMGGDLTARRERGTTVFELSLPVGTTAAPGTAART